MIENGNFNWDKELTVEQRNIMHGINDRRTKNKGKGKKSKPNEEAQALTAAAVEDGASGSDNVERETMVDFHLNEINLNIRKVSKIRISTYMSVYRCVCVYVCVSVCE